MQTSFVLRVVSLYISDPLFLPSQCTNVFKVIIQFSLMLWLPLTILQVLIRHILYWFISDGCYVIAGADVLSRPSWCVLRILCNTKHIKTMSLKPLAFVQFGPVRPSACQDSKCILYIHSLFPCGLSSAVVFNKSWHQGEDVVAKEKIVQMCPFSSRVPVPEALRFEPRSSSTCCF